MKTLQKLWITMKDLASPLPDPKKEVAEKYWTLPLSQLSGTQVELITALVIEGAQVSRGFGLFIRPEDLDFEIQFWLTFINLIGGPEFIKKNRTFEDLWQFASRAQSEEFETANRYYFNLISNSKPKIVASNNAYNVHLEDVRARILRAIYDNKLPLA